MTISPLQVPESEARPAYQEHISFALGIFLVIGGSWLAVWIIIKTMGLIYEPGNLPLFAKLSTQGLNTFATPAGNISMPPAMLLVSSYGITTALLFVLVAIAKSFLQIGASLLQPEALRLLKKIRRDLRVDKQ